MEVVLLCTFTTLSAKVVLSGDNVKLLVVSVSPFNVSCKFCISLF